MAGALLWAGTAGAAAQRTLCSDGYGSFTSAFSTGVTVTVGASHSGGFAAHACDASLQWGKNTLAVAQGAYQVDVDVFGADLGFGVPVVAFQIKKSEHDREMTYAVYSLTHTPKLLRTLSGGTYYEAADRDLEGRTAIWVQDAAMLDGFENLPLESFDVLPTMVLRFDHQQAIDVSAEYQADFDRQIAQIKAQADPQGFAWFKASDGKLSSNLAASLMHMHTLVMTKIAVLEIVWSYLDSGREPQAWSALEAMWPPADLSRIRAAIEDARAKGVRSHLQGVVRSDAGAGAKDHAVIYNMMTEKRKILVGGQSLADLAQEGQSNTSDSGEHTQFTVDTAPVPIFLGVTVSDEHPEAVPSAMVLMKLTVDAAGKVEEAAMVNSSDNGPIGDALIRSSKMWNFIPAYKGNRPVACQMQIEISPRQ